MRRCLVLLWCLAVPASAEPTWSLESAWSARQVFSAAGQSAGLAAWTSISGWTDPALWLGWGVGMDASVNEAGSFASLQPRSQLRAGAQFPAWDWALVVPWAGGAAGWAWGPQSPGLRWSVDVGVDTEFRLTGSHYAVVGVAYRSDFALEVSLALRDRSTWVMPFPSVKLLPSRPEITAVAMEVTSGAFSPDADGVGDQLVVALSTDAPSLVSSWVWTVTAPRDQNFHTRSGLGALPPVILWDGRSASGEIVSSATDYTLDLAVTDDTGKIHRSQTVITTDVLLLKDGDRYLIRLPSINFQANSPGLANTAPASRQGDRLVVTLQDQNAEVLARLAEILKKFPQYSITIVGHANLIQWEDPVKAAEEDRRESRPLSLQRAQSVKDALIKLGLDARRIKVEGAGGSRPLFPFGDPANAWKNRRVDVVLDRTSGR